MAVGVVVFASWAVYFSWQMARATHRPVGPVPADFPFPVEAVKFSAKDGLAIAGWFVPCSGATRAAVLLHGAKRSRLENVARARLMREHGYAVLLYDARGCGESAGDVLSFGFHETKDLLGALDFLRGRGYHQFGLIGFSQGGLTIVNAAPDLRDLSWVILECTPLDLRHTAGHDMRNAYGLPGWFTGLFVEPFVKWRLGVSPEDYVPPVVNIARLHCPLYFIASDADIRVLPEESRELFAHANEPKWLWMIPGVPHANFYPRPEPVYERHVLYFLKLAEKIADGK
jgi:pimeloyl-ACP methyl ester carboxylesterase